LRQESLIDAQTFSRYKADGQLHRQDRDVAKYWVDQHGERITVRLAFLGIENQSNYDPDMPLRVIGYDGAVYRAELSQKDRYPVVTLVLYFGARPWGKNRTIHDVVQIPEKFRPFVNDYKINLYEIANLPEEAVNHFHSDFRTVVEFFISVKKNHVYKPQKTEKLKHVNELLELMSVLTQDTRYKELRDAKGDKLENMREIWDRIEERGRKEGVDQTRLETIKSLMETMKLTAKQAMDAMKIPESEQSKYTARL